jgi:hypothetical protein
MTSPIPPASAKSVRMGAKLVYQPSPEKSFTGTVIHLPEREFPYGEISQWLVWIDFGEELGEDIVPLRNCYHQI